MSPPPKPPTKPSSQSTTSTAKMVPFRLLVASPAFRYNARMNTQLKIKKFGNSAGVVLPKDVLAHLDVAVGGTLALSKTPRGIELAAPDVDFDVQMAVAREVMARRKRALRELAK